MSWEEELGDSRQGNGTIKSHVFKFTLVALEGAVKSGGRRTAVAQGRHQSLDEGSGDGEKGQEIFQGRAQWPVPGYQR